MITLVMWGRKRSTGGRYLVQKEVAVALDEIKAEDEEVYNLLYNSITQGVGSATASNGTHRAGWCVDFSFKLGAWNRFMAFRVYRALKRRFAVAYRRAGEVSVTAHLHAALKGKENADAIIAANRGDTRVKDRIRQIFTV